MSQHSRIKVHFVAIFFLGGVYNAHGECNVFTISVLPSVLRGGGTELTEGGLSCAIGSDPTMEWRESTPLGRA